MVSLISSSSPRNSQFSCKYHLNILFFISFLFLPRFIEFGRGKVIPLTPENSKADLATEISNIGRIVVNKCIEKIEKVDTNASLLFGPYDLMGSNGSSNYNNNYNNNNSRKVGTLQHQQSQQGHHKKKRLYSLGGNEPIRIHRGRLNRLKTVGTFDLTIEEVPRAAEAAAGDGDDDDGTGRALECGGSGLTAASTTSTVNSTSTELITASSNPHSSSSCLNSPKESSSQLRRNRKGGKLARQIDCVGTSSESFDNKVGGSGAGLMRRAGQVRTQTTTTSSRLNSSLEATKTQLSTDDDDPVTMISNRQRGSGGGGSRGATTTTDSDEIRSPDDVFAKTKSILSSSSEFRARQSTFKKSKRITRTDSELRHDDEVYERGGSLAKYSTDSNDSVLSPPKTDEFGVMSSSMGTADTADDCDDDCDEQADRFSLQGTNLQREYKSDGNSLDEIGLQRDPDELPPQKWMNHSLENCMMSTTSMDCIPPKRDSSVDSARGKSETPPPPTLSTTSGKLFESPFAKFRKINQVWKCKKFSMSSGNVRKKEESIVSPDGDTVVAHEIISPTSVVSDSPKVQSSSSIFGKIRQQAMTATSSPSSSVASSRSHPRRLFSRLTSISNTELYKTGQSSRGTRTQCKDISKSNSEINNPASSSSVVSPFRKNTMRGGRQKSVKALRLEKMKNNSAGCLAERKMAITEPEGVHNVGKVQSPLSEEFYNKTGSVRLSAIELFEKFCSADFSGLYKHEDNNMMVGGRGISSQAAPAKRYIYRKNSKLLKQRSEPRFNLSMHPQQFRFDEDVILSETYYEEEGGGGMYDDEKEEDMEEEGEEFYEDEYFEEGEYEGYEEEVEGDEEEEEEQLAVEEVEEVVAPSGGNQKAQELQGYMEEMAEVVVVDKEEHMGMRRGRFTNLHIGHRVTEEDEEDGSSPDNGDVSAVVTNAAVVAGPPPPDERRQSDNMFIFENQEEEVDEIILMPETTCIASAYPTTASAVATNRNHLHRTEVIYDLNHLANDDENVTPANALLLSVIKDYVRHSGGETGEAEISLLDNCRDFEVKSVNNEDILTIYRICSEENLTVTRAHMKPSKSDTHFLSRRAFQSSLKTPQSSCRRHRKHSHASSTRSGPTPLVTVEMDNGDGFLARTGSNESDFGELLDEEEDTVRLLCPDSYGSKLSLSLFDDLSLNFSLTINEERAADAGTVGKKLLAPDCDAEDFNLTSEGSVSECVDPQFRIGESLPSDGSSENNNSNNINSNTMNDEAEESGKVEDEGPPQLSRNASSEEKKDPEKETPVNEGLPTEHLLTEQESLSSLPEDSIDLVMMEEIAEGEEEEGEAEQIGEDGEEEEEDENENDPNKVSRFTNALQKEFDMLFDIAATKPNVEVESIEPQPPSGHGSMKMHRSASGQSHGQKSEQNYYQGGGGNSLMASIRTRISSRHSMQNLEPYEPMTTMMLMMVENGNNNPDYQPRGDTGERAEQQQRNELPKASKSVDQLNEREVEVDVVLNSGSKKGLLSVAAAVAAKNNNHKSRASLVVVAGENKGDGGGGGGGKEKERKSRKTMEVARNNVNEDDSEMYVGCVHLLCSRFKKRKSLSLGNLEKSKCFPL